MRRGRMSKYFWPASAITPADMALVYAIRESSLPRIPISQLIARAVRAQYGQAIPAATVVPKPDTLPKAA